MRVAILTDTNSGINKKEADQKGIFVIPMPVIIDGTTYFEGIDLTEELFYEYLKNGHDVSTSQPSPGDVLEMWDEIFKKGYDEIVYIPMSSGLSSSCSVAEMFSKDDKYNEKVFVVDNHRISVTLRTSVEKAQKLSILGYTGAQIKEYIENDTYNSIIYVAVDTLTYLKKGGRVTPAAAAIGTVLNIKPVLTIKGGKLDSFSKLRGALDKNQAKIIALAREDFNRKFPNADMSKVHAGAAGAGLTLDERECWTKTISEAFPGATVFYDPLSASIGTHTGPGALGIGISVDTEEL